MGQDEGIVFFISGVLCLVGLIGTASSGLHALYYRGNPSAGLFRVSLLAAMAFIAYVLWFRADPSVVGIHRAFYLVMGFGATTVFGAMVAPGVVGLGMKRDAAERRNLGAAFYVAAMTLGTGLIFGGSVWGEADPEGGGEGGWWIPAGHFAAGYVGLLLVVAIFHAREPGKFGERVKRERSVVDGRAAAAYALSTAVAFAQAVAGDFFGWASSALGLGVILVMLLVHEIFRPRVKIDPATMSAAPVAAGRRVVESVLYAVLGLATWGGAWALRHFLGVRL